MIIRTYWASLFGTNSNLSTVCILEAFSAIRARGRAVLRMVQVRHRRPRSRVDASDRANLQVVVSQVEQSLFRHGAMLPKLEPLFRRWLRRQLVKKEKKVGTASHRKW